MRLTLSFRSSLCLAALAMLLAGCQAFRSSSSGNASLPLADRPPPEVDTTKSAAVRVAKGEFDRTEGYYQQASRLEGEARKQAFLELAPIYARLADAMPDTAQEEKSLYRVGECYMFADRYPQAVSAYARLLNKYKNSRYMDRLNAHRFAIAQWWMQKHRENPRFFLTPNFTDPTQPRFDTQGNAFRVLNAIRLDDPVGKFADDATMAAANGRFALGDYQTADQLYADLREAFPNSEHQYKAHLLGVQTKLRLYQGPLYNTGPLEEAEKLIAKMKRQFRRQVADDREYIDRAAAIVRREKAIHDWTVAQYFERRGEYGAARYYYEIMQRDYPGTEVASQARERLAQIGDLPAKPPQRLPWLAAAFEPLEAAEKPTISPVEGAVVENVAERDGDGSRR